MSRPARAAAVHCTVMPGMSTTGGERFGRPGSGGHTAPAHLDPPTRPPPRTAAPAFAASVCFPPRFLLKLNLVSLRTRRGTARAQPALCSFAGLMWYAEDFVVTFACDVIAVWWGHISGGDVWEPPVSSVWRHASEPGAGLGAISYMYA
ncbi:hypothetical protein PLESTB_000076300 [Pleodorina starrii]|uniref:Uncharacterized protein n=1 Tax=Pleodorina starrii TaxID=330485 RepID=A0A9W6BA23_9CHLO|nr:hypothetical protein PLESTM_000071900 [Pleodorina starrii]GLC48259.1 hypothetical protein PLESTB_000076300 [Pleodorina starrii]